MIARLYSKQGRQNRKTIFNGHFVKALLFAAFVKVSYSLRLRHFQGGVVEERLIVYMRCGNMIKH